MLEVAKFFSPGARILYEAVLNNAWDPKILKGPDTVEKLVKADPRLTEYRTGDEEKDKKLFHETYEYAIFLAAQNLELDEDGTYQMRTNPLRDDEISDFLKFFLKHLPNDIDRKDVISLTDHDIRDIVTRDPQLNKSVEDLIDSNQDLKENLFIATAELIQKRRMSHN